MNSRGAGRERTKFGMFVELNDMFIEGLVPLASLADDHYLYHENTRQIIGQRTRKTYSMGDPIRVIVDRLDPFSTASSSPSSRIVSQDQTPVRSVERHDPSAMFRFPEGTPHPAKCCKQ